VTVLDIARLSMEERLELIERLWDSLEAENLPLPPAQAAELDRRLETIDADIADAREADIVLRELRDRYR
jgi:putative addiction module component (TIGR02574 family)